MFRNIFLKTLYDRRWFVVGWGAGVMAMFAFTAAFFPTFRDSGLGEVMKAVPPALQSLMGDLANYMTFEGYIGSAVFGLRAQMILVPLALILGILLGVSDEGTGRLHQLLAQPLSRRRIVLSKYFAGIVITGIISLLSIVSVGLVAPFVGEQVPYDLLGKIGLMTFLFTSAVFALTYGLGKAFGRRSLAVAIPIVWTIGSMLVDAFSSQADWMKNIEHLSLLRYYQTSSLSGNPIDPWHVAILLGVILIPLVIALILFPRRDIREES